MLTQEICVTLDGEAPFFPLAMRQGDSGRKIRAVVQDADGNGFDVSGFEVLFQARKHDGKRVVRSDGISVSGNVVEVGIDAQTLAVPGQVQCELVFMDGSALIGTVSWHIDCQAAAVTNANIKSSDNYQFIDDAVRQAEGSAESAKESAEEAQRIKDTMRPEFDVQQKRVGVKFPDEDDYQYTGDLTGPQGIQGVQGIQGPQGEQGYQGESGFTFDAGAYFAMRVSDAGDLILVCRDEAQPPDFSISSDGDLILTI